MTSSGRIFAEHRDRRFHTISVASLDPPPPPFGSAAYPLLIWDHVGGWSDAARVQFARSLIEGGCRYALCAGRDMIAWHIAFDLASVHVDTSDANFVMTGDHDRETVDEIAFFFAFNTNFGDHDFANLLLLHVGGGPESTVIEDAIRRQLASAV
jgi:hypothetical protein